MGGFGIAELIIIYGFLSLFAVIGILFLLQWNFFRKGFYGKYTIHKKATVKKMTGGRLGTPVISYVCEIDGKEEILVEQSSIGAPFYVPNEGDEVDVYIHPDPNKKVSLSQPPNTTTRVFVCEKRSLSMSRFYLGMGLAFATAGLLGIIMFTVTN
ncbi:MAG: hypothetical protein K6F92_00845 [Lachnospiraceae bacterium]|nr:hypothetical protein [Lachnospiraceae bacterium]